MADDPLQKTPYQSDQERIVHVISSNSLGYRDVFIPENVSKSLEPCDLAWAAGETVILFYCKASKKKPQDYLDGKNLGQAQDWLRNWSEEKILFGKNEVRQFEYPRSSIRNIIVISIVEGSFSGSCRHLKVKPYYYSLGLISAFSIPINIIFKAFAFSFNCSDLINFCSRIASDGEISEEESLAIIAECANAGFAEAVDYAKEQYKIDVPETEPISFIPRIKSTAHANMNLNGIGVWESSWINGVVAVGVATVGSVKPGTSGTAFICVKRTFSNLDIVVSINLNFETMAEKANDTIPMMQGDNVLLLTATFMWLGDVSIPQFMIGVSGSIEDRVEEPVNDLKNILAAQ